MDIQPIKEYLNILRYPSIATDKEGRINPFEFNSFKAELENKRLGFILAISEIENKQTVDLILQELIQVKEAIIKRGFASVNDDDVLGGILAGHSEFETFYQIQVVERMLLDSAENTLSNLKTDTTAESTFLPEETRLQKKLKDYPELLTVKDIMSIFNVTARTVGYWEDNGILINVSETSNEVNINGKRKRGKEKRYRKEAILQSIQMNEKYNILCNQSA